MNGMRESAAPLSAKDMLSMVGMFTGAFGGTQSMEETESRKSPEDFRAQIPAVPGMLRPRPPHIPIDHPDVGIIYAAS